MVFIASKSYHDPAAARVELANAPKELFGGHCASTNLRYSPQILYNRYVIVPKRKGSSPSPRRVPRRRRRPQMIDLAEKIKKKLKDEIAALEHELHDELPKEIKVARAHGDLSENAEYKYAKERQSFVSTRLAQLHQRMADLSMLNLSNLPKDRAAYGSRLIVLDVAKGTKIEYKLVTVEEADAPNGLISTSSPIGRALLGKKVGDEVKVTTPAGLKEYEVVTLSTIYDEE
jgi:transcription elongation factor GreA